MGAHDVVEASPILLIPLSPNLSSGIAGPCHHSSTAFSSNILLFLINEIVRIFKVLICSLSQLHTFDPLASTPQVLLLQAYDTYQGLTCSLNLLMS